MTPSRVVRAAGLLGALALVGGLGAPASAGTGDKVRIESVEATAQESTTSGDFYTYWASTAAVLDANGTIGPSVRIQWNVGSTSTISVDPRDIVVLAGNNLAWVEAWATVDLQECTIPSTPFGQVTCVPGAEDVEVHLRWDGEGPIMRTSLHSTTVSPLGVSISTTTMARRSAPSEADAGSVHLAVGGYPEISMITTQRSVAMYPG